MVTSCVVFLVQWRVNTSGARKPCRIVTAEWDSVHRQPKRETSRHQIRERERERERETERRAATPKMLQNSIPVQNVLFVLGQRMRHHGSTDLAARAPPRNCCQGRREGVISKTRNENETAATKLIQTAGVEDRRLSARVVAYHFHHEWKSSNRSR